MRRIRLLPLCAALAACVNIQSLDTAVPQSAAVMEPRLLGEWVVVNGNGKREYASVLDAGRSEYRIRYIDERNDTSLMIGRLGRFDRRWLLDLKPTGDGERIISKFNGVLAHGQVVLEMSDSGMRATVFNGDSLKRALTANQAPYLGYLITPGGDVLLTDSAPRLYQGLLRYARRPNVFNEWYAFRHPGPGMAANTPAAAPAASERTARVLDNDSMLRGGDSAVAGRSDFDVEVLHRQAERPTLWFVLYRRQDGVLRRFMPFAAEDTTQFAAVTYAWSNDSTVVIRLRDAAGRPVAGYQITGYLRNGNIRRL